MPPWPSQPVSDAAGSVSLSPRGVVTPRPSPRRSEPRVDSCAGVESHRAVDAGQCMRLTTTEVDPHPSRCPYVVLPSLILQGLTYCPVVISACKVPVCCFPLPPPSRLRVLSCGAQKSLCALPSSPTSSRSRVLSLRCWEVHVKSLCVTSLTSGANKIVCCYCSDFKCKNGEEPSSASRDINYIGVLARLPNLSDLILPPYSTLWRFPWREGEKREGDSF